ncbi:MAG: hypothetical protein P1V51_20110 [Deltaproteobacteria bacterium]|nr:hypothetical protein [Deltaproteobacteria bacterium]
MSLLSGAYLAELATGGANDAWVQSFGYEPQYSTETHNAFGFVDPVLVEDTYNGVKGSFDILPNASNLIEACLTRQDVATAKAFDPALFNAFFVIVNVRNTKTNAFFRSHLVKNCKVVGNPYSSSVDGKATLKFDFEGTGVVKYALPLQITQEAGTNTPSQVVTPSSNMTQVAAKYAQLVFVDDVLKVITTDYTETASAVTMVAAVPTTSKVTVISCYTPA